MGLFGAVTIYGLSGVVTIMGLSGGVIIIGLSGGVITMGLSGGGGAVTIMELSGDGNTDTGLLDMISKLFIMN